MHELIEKLESIPATIIGGIFLIASFVFSLLKINIPFDLAWVTVLVSGVPLLYSAIRKLIKNKGISKISSALLISTAMIAAIVVGDLFAAAEVAFIMAIGEILEHLTTHRAKRGLKNLINLSPIQGRKITFGKEEMILSENIKEGDVLRVLPGEAIPVDGIIIQGDSSIDQSVITGESLPVDKSLGDEVFCGTINCFGSIDIKATKVGENSSLQRLIRMVKEAEEKKAPMQRITDKWASFLVPIALIIAIITFVITKDVIRGVTVLVVFCPCALVLATPTAIMAAIGQATKKGIIIKSGEALEKMGKVNTIAFDKTGTLTFGKLEVSDIIPLSDLTIRQVLFVAASAEAKSEHPLGKSIVNYGKKSNINLLESIDFRMTRGKGIFASFSIEDFSKHDIWDSVKKEDLPNEVYIGNEKFLEEHSINIKEDVLTQLETLRFSGKATVLIATKQKCLGIIALSDVIRPETFEIIKKLENLNTETALLTGDNKKTANYFANQAGIKNVFPELLPEEKVLYISKFQQKGKTVSMIGDGVNDAPALKSANVGIAMGNMGSDIAVEAADIALMKDGLSKIPYLKRLSRATVRTIRFSIALSMIINFLAVGMSVLGMLNPTTGALVHNAGSVIVVLIASVLYDRNFEK